jgi:hypothetical protein
MFISSNYARIVARELRLQERDLPRLLVGTGLSRQVMLPGDETRLTGVQQLRIIENARKIDPSPELGLRTGRHLQPSTHGPIGYLALSSLDLITALRSLRDFLPLRIGMVQLGLERSGPWLKCRLQLKIIAPLVSERMLLECFALLLQTLVESILGKPLEDARFEFAFRAPAYRKVYGDYFHSPSLFSREQSQLLVPRELAYTPNTSGDPGSFSLARDLCQTLLEQEGSGYRAIRETLFAELAARHLRESNLSVESIAALLGYHDSSNFRRACRRWYGVSPRELRHNQSLDVSVAALT